MIDLEFSFAAGNVACTGIRLGSPLLPAVSVVRVAGKFGARSLHWFL